MWFEYNHILASFEHLQKFCFLNKKLYFEGIRARSVTERFTLYTRKFIITESKFSISWNQVWSTRKEDWKSFLNFEKLWFCFYRDFTHSSDFSYTFRPKQEEIDIFDLKDRIQQLELQVDKNRRLINKTSIESSRILKEYQSTWNAYRSIDSYDSEEKKI